MPANDINRRLFSVGALTDLYEARIREYGSSAKVHQKHIKRGRVRFVFVTHAVREGLTECKKNDDLNQLKSNHLVSDRKKWFETMLSEDGPTSECKKTKPTFKIQANSHNDHILKEEHMTETIPDSIEASAEGMVNIVEEDQDPPHQTADQQHSSETEEVSIKNNEEIPQKCDQEDNIEETTHYKRRYLSRTVDRKQISEYRKSIKESIVQEFRDLSLDGMEELDDMNDEETSMCKSIIRSWSQQNLDVLTDEEDGEINQKIFDTVSRKCGQESEIDIYINGIKEDYRTLAAFSDGQESNSARSSGRFIKNEHRSSGSRRSIRVRKPKAVETAKYGDDSESDGVIDHTKDESTVRNSMASSSAYESGDEEPDFDIFGFTNFNDYAIEAYNPQFYENILFKISLSREMINIPVIEKKYSSNLKRQNNIDTNTQHNSENYDNHSHDNGLNGDRDSALGENIYENCVPLNSDGNVEYDLMNVRSVEDATCKMKKHIYENHMISNNDNVVGGAYLDENLNSRIEIICDPNVETAKHSLEVPPRLTTQLSSPTPKLQHIIKELIDTENKYIENMEYVIHQYLKYFLNHPKRRRELPGIAVIFGNIESLYESSQKILQDLRNCDSSVDCIANIFMQNKQLFDLYAAYMRNKSRTQAIVENFRIPLTERQRELNDKKSCDSYLLTPIQRPGRYKLLLESLQKELTKLGEENRNLDAAIRFVDQNIQQANTLLAIDSIGPGCPIDLTKCGSFLLKDVFNIKRKYKSVVFLFEGIIVFTTENKNKPDTYDYKDSINANDLTLKTDNKSTSFIVKDFPKCKYSDDGRYSFEIETASEHVCKKWVNEIGGILWNQLSHFRQLQDKQREAPKVNGIIARKEVKEVKQKRSLDRTNSVFYIQHE